MLFQKNVRKKAVTLFRSVICKKTKFVLILYFKIYSAKLEKNDETLYYLLSSLSLYYVTFYA